MINRFYLIPNESDGSLDLPRHVYELGVTVDSVFSTTRQYFGILIARENASDFDHIESLSGVTRIWREDYQALADLGIDVSSLSQESTDLEIGAVVLGWLGCTDCRLELHGLE